MLTAVMRRKEKGAGGWRLHVVYGRDGLVERGVEDGDLRDARQDFLDRQHAFEVG